MLNDYYMLAKLKYKPNLTEKSAFSIFEEAKDSGRNQKQDDT